MMFVYIKGPLRNKFTTEHLIEEKKKTIGPKVDVNEMKITSRHVTDLSVQVRRLCGCEGCQDPLAKEIIEEQQSVSFYF